MDDCGTHATGDANPNSYIDDDAKPNRNAYTNRNVYINAYTNANAYPTACHWSGSRLQF